MFEGKNFNRPVNQMFSFFGAGVVVLGDFNNDFNNDFLI
jgi:hypothetical protein